MVKPPRAHLCHPARKQPSVGRTAKAVTNLPFEFSVQNRTRQFSVQNRTVRATAPRTWRATGTMLHTRSVARAIGTDRYP
jgi:hypothetical protein